MESYQGEATGRLGENYFGEMGERATKERLTGRLGESYFGENGWRATKGRLLVGWERVTCGEWMESYQGEATGRLGESYFVENGWRATKGRLPGRLGESYFVENWWRATQGEATYRNTARRATLKDCLEPWMDATMKRPLPGPNLSYPMEGYRDIPCRAILGRLPNDCLESYIGQIAEVLGEGLLLLKRLGGQLHLGDYQRLRRKRPGTNY